MTKDLILEKFDNWVESRAAIVFNWCWKSGLMILIIGLIGQNLNYQVQNHIYQDKVFIENKADRDAISLLVKATNKMSCDNKAILAIHEKKIDAVEYKVIFLDNRIVRIEQDKNKIGITLPRAPSGG